MAFHEGTLIMNCNFRLYVSIVTFLLTTHALAESAQHKSRLPAHLALGDLEMTGRVPKAHGQLKATGSHKR